MHQTKQALSAGESCLPSGRTEIWFIQQHTTSIPFPKPDECEVIIDIRYHRYQKWGLPGKVSKDTDLRQGGWVL